MVFVQVAAFPEFGCDDPFRLIVDVVNGGGQGLPFLVSDSPHHRAGAEAHLVQMQHMLLSSGKCELGLPYCLGSDIHDVVVVNKLLFRPLTAGVAHKQKLSLPHLPHGRHVDFDQILPSVQCAQGVFYPIAFEPHAQLVAVKLKLMSEMRLQPTDHWIVVAFGNYGQVLTPHLPHILVFLHWVRARIKRKPEVPQFKELSVAASVLLHADEFGEGKDEHPAVELQIQDKMVDDISPLVSFQIPVDDRGVGW